MKAFSWFPKDKAEAYLLSKYQNQEFRSTSNSLYHQVSNSLQDVLHEVKPDTKI